MHNMVENVSSEIFETKKEKQERNTPFWHIHAQMYCDASLSDAS